MAEKTSNAETIRAALDGIIRRVALVSPHYENARNALAALEEMKRERLEAEPSPEAWKELIRWAYSNDSDGARRIQEITTHYNQLRAEIDRLHLTINAGRDADEKMRREHDTLLFRVKNHEELLDCIGERLGVANNPERFAGDDLDNAVGALVAERDRLRAELAASQEREGLYLEALKPLKEWADALEGVNWVPDACPLGTDPTRHKAHATVGDLRRASALATPEGTRDQKTEGQ